MAGAAGVDRAKDPARGYRKTIRWDGVDAWGDGTLPRKVMPVLCTGLWRLWLVCLLALVPPAALAAGAPVNIAGPAYGTQITADTEFGPQYAGSFVADGVIAKGPGGWFSRDESALPQALTFRFAQRERLETVVLHQAFWEGSMYHCRNVAVEVSDDGAAWTRLTEVEMPDESAARVEVPLGGVEANSLRLVVLSSYVAFQTCGLVEVEVLAGGRPVAGQMEFVDATGPLPASLPVCGLQVLGRSDGPQVALASDPATFTVVLEKGETLTARIPLSGLEGNISIGAEASTLGGSAPAEIALGEVRMQIPPIADQGRVTTARMETSLPGSDHVLEITTTAKEAGTTVRWWGVTICAGGKATRVQFSVPPVWKDTDPGPPPAMPTIRPALEDVLVEWDWRMQDGIGTALNPSTYADALTKLLARGKALASGGTLTTPDSERWRAFARSAETRTADEALWREAHVLLRELLLAANESQIGPLLFVKQVPPAFSHQLTQYYGRYARPGGGVFVLDRPGRSMRVRDLTAGQLPLGSPMQPELSPDGTRLMFAFAETPATPEDRRTGHHGRYYHLYTMATDGSGLSQLTEGPFDDFSPRYLPDGRIVFISTRRLGWHRCGSPGCENYTLAIANADGGNATPVSYHETQEWDPAVLDDGRIVYTRWDYVDRHAVFYEQLWTVRTDGSAPNILYGNNTFNPVGIWEPRQVPGSHQIMATAAAHHAMTAGSIILVDSAAGVDGPEPITRLTPDAPFPESETIVAPSSWHAPLTEVALVTTPEEARWPGHCYRSPYPLSESTFLAAYSYDRLIGEPASGAANMFGLYLMDRFGNKELLYRDYNTASAWPIPIRPRSVPPATHGVSFAGLPESEGVVTIQDIRVSDPQLPAERIAAVRVVQLVPKSTSGANNPTVGLASASPGKQVLGTAPVESDGSACFRVPAGIPLAFQALDENGMAVQTMRSVTYAQPGQMLSCTGCHEARTSAPPNQLPIALLRAPSVLKPSPDGAKPLSYPILVQPVLDRNCVSCHEGAEAKGGVRLTGEPEGRYSASYNALAPLVRFAEWKGGADFREASSEPLAKPLFFGARGSTLTRYLLGEHYGVTLAGEDLERLVTWMDANALFYGTFDPADQERQQRGERIAGPTLE